MKKFYLPSLLVLLLQLCVQEKSSAQCVGGSAPTQVAFDTTISFNAGVTSAQIKFPKFDPQNGMLNCVKLIVTMVGVVDSVGMQNLAYSNQTATFNYKRDDQMTGPGLVTPLTNSINKDYGPYNLTGFDNNFTSGTDYVSIPRDTVLRQQLVRTLNDSAEISQFYGSGYVTYNYNINVTTTANISGGNGSSLVLTSGYVNFRFEYCQCPSAVLPLGVKNFAVNKTSPLSANLTWEGMNDDYVYTYDIEVSRNGRDFSRIATVPRKFTPDPKYLYNFQLPENEGGQVYFRVRQHWTSGYVRYTGVRSAEFSNPLFATTSLYPNPTSGKAGIKFVNTRGGKMLVQVTNAHGQQVASKEIVVSPTDYLALSPLPNGVYWVKITDAASGTSCTRQLVVQ